MHTDLFPTLTDLEAGLPFIRQSPPDAGPISLIVCRPESDGRAIVQEADLSREAGLAGDAWASSRAPDADKQLTLMNSRVLSLLARTTDRWALAGDQLFVDLDLSTANLPAGTRLAVGSAIVEITAQPHLGCRKFASRFGHDGLVFVNNPLGKELRLRGVYARVVQPGRVQTDDAVTKRRTPLP